MGDSSSYNPVTRAIVNVVRMPKADFDRMIECLESHPFPSRQLEARQRIHKAAPDITEDSAGAIIGFASAFAAALTRVDDSDDFIESIVKRAESDAGEEWDGEVLSRMRALLKSPAIAFLGMGESALRDRVQAFQEVNIELDLRPLPVPNHHIGDYFAVVHRMRVDYSSGAAEGQSESVELVLDHRDLVRLSREIEKALSEQSSIQDKIAGSGGMTFMPYEEDGDTSE